MTLFISLIGRFDLSVRAEVIWAKSSIGDKSFARIKYFEQGVADWVGTGKSTELAIYIIQWRWQLKEDRIKKCHFISFSEIDNNNNIEYFVWTIEPFCYWHNVSYGTRNNFSESFNTSISTLFDIEWLELKWPQSLQPLTRKERDIRLLTMLCNEEHIKSYFIVINYYYDWMFNTWRSFQLCLLVLALVWLP